MSHHPDLPIVSVVIPMLDELGHIEACLDGFADQSYPTDHIELIVVDGGSTDGSRAIVDQRAASEQWIQVVENPDRRASAAFNRGVEAAVGSVVCLFSSHGVPSATYVERSVDVLEETGATGVGGRYHHEGTDRVSNAIGLAMVSPFGMASRHRFATNRAEVDTISHPAYRAAALREVGPFDESLLRNSDYELNWRMRQSGHRLIFDPTIESIYRPRPSLAALGKQFWHYGRWKARVAARHPGSLRIRHLAAPVAVTGVAASPLLLAGRAGRWVVAAGALGYALGVGAAVWRARPADHRADPVVLAGSFPVMHASWGAGFIVSVLQDLIRRRST